MFVSHQFYVQKNVTEAFLNSTKLELSLSKILSAISFIFKKVTNP